MRSAWLPFALLLALGTLLLGPQPAAAGDPFYKGKRLVMLINFAAGGPTDIEGRLLARHLGKHIEGNPSIVIQNMDGAGGLIGANYLGKVAPKDGTMMGYFTGATWVAANEPERYETKFDSYQFVAYQGGTSVYVLRSDTAPGMKQATDIAHAKGLVAGGLEAGQAKDLLIRLALEMLGVPFRYVTGYRSNTNVRLALQNGEVNFLSESPPGYLTAIQPELVKTGEAIPVFYDPAWNGETLGISKQVAGLPILPFQELYTQIKGAPPAGRLWDAYLTILGVNSAMQRLIVLPPGAPQEAVAALQTAVLRLDEDKAFAEESMRAVGFTPDYVAGPETARQIRQVTSLKPEMRGFLADYAKAQRK
jgi:tripartite-type tricarboxylate transporter receptor subunit TctC